MNRFRLSHPLKFAVLAAFLAAASAIASVFLPGPADGAQARQSTLTLSLTFDVTGQFSQDIYSTPYPGEFSRLNYRDNIHLTYRLKTKWKVGGGQDASSERMDLLWLSSTCTLAGMGDGNWNSYETGEYSDTKTNARMRSVSTRDSGWTYAVNQPSSPPTPSVDVSPKRGRFQVGSLENIFDWDDIKATGWMKTYSKGPYGTFSDASETPFGAIMAMGFCNFANMYVMSEQARQALSGPVQPGKPFAVSGTVTKVVTLEDFRKMSGGSAPAASPDEQSSDDGGGKLTITYTLGYNRDPDDLEAIFVLPKGFDSWQPEAGKNENVPGNDIAVGVRLQRTDNPDQQPEEKARFTFELLDTSSEPGTCVNYPGPDSVTNPAPFDMQIVQEDNTDLKVEEKGQTASTKGEPSLEASVRVRAFDFGAFAILKATARVGDRTYIAHLPGDETRQFLKMPQDENGNRVADAWEKKVGCFAKNLSAGWDGADDPAGQGTTGDGISLYEKYRGFYFAGIHEQLEPYNKKYVFCYDPTGGVQDTLVSPRMKPYAFTKVSKTGLRFVDDDSWTGTGSSENGKRIVNFNHAWPTGHAVDQHALWVELDAALIPVAPPGYNAWRVTAGLGAVHDPSMTTSGRTFPDASASDAPWSPGDTYEIQVYPGTIKRMIRWTVAFHLNSTEADAEKYINEHRDDWAEHYSRLLSQVISHEMSHGVGAPDHTPRADGDKKCVMRYFLQEDCPRNPADPFELKARTWPDSLCAGCWGRVNVSDRR